MSVLSKKLRDRLGCQTYQAREKAPGEVLAPANDIWERPVYRVGDGDTGTYVPRPGSLRAFTLPSKGIST